MSKLKVNKNIFTNPFAKLQGLASIVFFIFIYSIFITGSTYAFMNLAASSSTASGQGGCFEVSYTGQNLNAGNLLSTDDYLEGAHTTVTLSKASTCKIYTEANIYLHTNETATAPIESVKALRYKLMTGETTVSEGIVSNKGDYLLATVPLTNTATTYTLYLWVDFNLSSGSYDETTYTGYIYADSNQTSTIENSYLVNFNSSGGSTVTPKNVIYGQTYGSLQTPTKDGYTFQGWSLVPASNQNTGSTQYITSSSTVSQEHNHTLYAVWEPKTYTVSFNANGGSVSTTSKQVTFNETYGDLPTPTKSGSKFKGWHGKNLINIANHNINFTNTYYLNRESNPHYVLTANKNYTLSFNYMVNSSSNPIIASVGYGTNSFQRDIKSSSTYSGIGRMILDFATPSTFSYTPANVWFRFARMTSPGDANVDISSIQLEEGTTATAYEPYYVTYSTTVTQPKNHTLTAIWE